ncbi:MAG TPA: hypothetical protein VLG47_04910 [Candidatus Saccharimonadales bacterium]|nr:hypothetical protein [Candidatus Saccharimonadales bacterium]
MSKSIHGSRAVRGMSPYARGLARGRMHEGDLRRDVGEDSNRVRGAIGRLLLTPPDINQLMALLNQEAYYAGMMIQDLPQPLALRHSSTLEMYASQSDRLVADALSYLRNDGLGIFANNKIILSVDKIDSWSANSYTKVGIYFNIEDERVRREREVLRGAMPKLNVNSEIFRIPLVSVQNPGDGSYLKKFEPIFTAMTGLAVQFGSLDFVSERYK